MLELKLTNILKDDYGDTIYLIPVFLGLEEYTEEPELFYRVNNGQWLSTYEYITVPNNIKYVEVYGKLNILKSNILKVEINGANLILQKEFHDVVEYIKSKRVKNPNVFDYKNYSEIGDDNIEYIGFPRRNTTRVLNNGSEEIEITERFKNRIDLVASYYLGNGRLWWVIADLNDLENPMDLPVGSKLLIPRTDDIYGVGGPMRDSIIKSYNESVEVDSNVEP